MDAIAVHNVDANLFVQASRLAAGNTPADRIAVLNESGDDTDSVQIEHSALDAATATISTVSGTFLVRIASSRLSGGAVVGTATCAQVWDEAFVAADGPACP
jgi:hypothetical protein